MNANEQHIEHLVSEKTELKRDLNLFSAINLVVGGVVGSGIFLVASGIADKVPSPMMIIVAWIVGGLLSLAGCLTYSELSGAMPRSGGQYVYLREAYGDRMAFLNGWTQFLVVQPGSIASVAACFGVYCGYFLDISSMQSRLIAVAVVAFLTVVNVFGVKAGGKVNNVFTILKIGAIFVLICAGFFGGVHGGALSSGNFTSMNGFSLSAFGFAMIAVLWGYQGWDYTTFVAEEVKDPKRNIPRALGIGMLIIIAVYILTNLAYLNVLPVDTIANSDLTATDVAKATMGSVGGAFIAIAILVSCFGTDDANILAAPRIYYAMSEDGLFFKKMSEIHPKYKTPAFSLIASGIWTCLLVLTNSFDQLYSMTVFAAFTFYAMGGIAIFILRRKYPNIERPYKCPSWIVGIFVIVSIIFVINTLITDPRNSLFGCIIIAIGFPVYYFFDKSRKAKQANIK